MIGPPTQRARTHQRRNRNPRNRAVTVTPVEPHGNLKDYSGSLSFPTSRGHNSSAPLPANFASGFCGVQRVRADTTLVDQDRLWQLPVKDYQHDKYAQSQRTQSRRGENIVACVSQTLSSRAHVVNAVIYPYVLVCGFRVPRVYFFARYLYSDGPFHSCH
ncbi:hypothetical protein KQX54_018037 [Cotesia glomerata]|uniref:Uncharacterized protein n=1 Tax=Cotesia glomerata TaxID=32391 RepID=A0AAV7IFW5_COTGL|nr:hypothetical protein KQX54_018037 [Cotesia glomerata]